MSLVGAILLARDVGALADTGAAVDKAGSASVVGMNTGTEAGTGAGDVTPGVGCFLLDFDSLGTSGFTSITGSDCGNWITACA